MRRFAAGFVSVLTVALLGGCAQQGGGSVTVSGKSLTLYISTPVGAAASDPVAQDVIDAEQLAFSDHHAEVSGFTLNLKVLHGAKLSDNARTAISNKQAIAYVGEIQPGDSADSLGITNDQSLLQVTPTDTAVELTQQSSAVPGSPGNYYEALKNYGRTFTRVVPTSAKEAKAQTSEMQSLGVKQLYIASDGSDYGKAIAAALRGDVSGAGITVASSASAADAVFLAGRDPAAFASVVRANPTLKVFAPSALATSSAVSALGLGSGAKLFVSTPGFLKKQLTATGQKFVTDFTAKYGHAPATEAILGYEAMAAVLHVLTQAGAKANDRATVVKDFLALRNVAFVLPTQWSINNATGDTNLGAFVFSRARGDTLVPFAAVTAPG
jgi:ABC-type branched-subunit amino acid transport system substrate-binding protein